MKKLTVFLMTIVFMSFMGLSVLATSDEPKPVDPIDPVLVDPSEKPEDGTVINPCGENVEVCIFTTGEGTSSEGTVVDVKEDTEGSGEGSVGDEVAPDCVKDPTVCQRPDVTHTLAPADGKYEDGIYYMTGDKDAEATKDTSMVTISVVASTLGLIALGFAANRKFKKN